MARYTPLELHNMRMLEQKLYQALAWYPGQLQGGYYADSYLKPEDVETRLLTYIAADIHEKELQLALDEELESRPAREAEYKARNAEHEAKWSRVREVNAILDSIYADHRPHPVKEAVQGATAGITRGFRRPGSQSL